MNYERIAKPQWLTDLENEEPPFIDDEDDYNKRTTKGYFAPKGKKFPFIVISITYKKFDEPGLGKAVGFSVSMKYSLKSFFEPCSLPVDLMGEYLKLMQEAYDKKPKE